MDDKKGKSIEIEDYLNILDRVIGFIGNCDNKTSIILGIYGVFFGIVFTSNFFNNFIKSLILIKINFFTIIYIFFIICTLILFLYGIIKLFKALYAKIDSEVYAEDELITNSYIFYGTISNFSFRKYKNEIQDLSEEEFRNDILSQIYIDSKICNQKFQNYNKGLIYSFLGLLSFIILMIIGMLII